MAYEKQTWACGDTITAEKLNHMESGIASGGVYELTIEKEGDYYVIPGEQVKAIVDDFPAIVKAPTGWYDDAVQTLVHFSTFVMQANGASVTSMSAVIPAQTTPGEMGSMLFLFILDDEEDVVAEITDIITRQLTEYTFMYDAESNTYRCAIEG